jgi:hypothetical protein
MGGSVMNDIDLVNGMIYKRPPESQKRIFLVAQILRDLLSADNEKRENELALTLVLCELADRKGV